MILLDTNVLQGSAFGPSTSATMLWGVSRVTGHPIALPQLVLDEYLANYTRQVQAAIDKPDPQRLLGRVPSWPGRAAVARGESAEVPSIGSAVSNRRDAITKLSLTWMRIARSSEGAAEEGQRRERERIPPAANGDEGRDVVVWLTAMQQAWEVRPSMLYFVSGDQGFQDPYHQGRLHPYLGDEAPENLVFLPSTDALIDRLSCHDDPPDGVASSDSVLGAIRDTAVGSCPDRNNDLRRDLWDWTPEGADQLHSSSQVTPSLDDVRDVVVRSRRCGTTRLVAIDAVYRLDLEFDRVTTVTGRTTVAESVSVRLGVLVRYEEDNVVATYVLARNGLRAVTPDGS